MNRSVTMAIVLLLILSSLSQPLSASRRGSTVEVTLADGSMEGKRGSTIEVTMIDGRQVKGELLAVKGHDLIIHDQSRDQGFTVNIEQVSGVRIKKRSRALSGLAIGFINGMAAGVIISRSRDDGDGGERAGAAIVGLMIWGAVTVIGAMTGAFISLPEEMATNGREPVQIAGYLRRLQRHARDPL